MHLMKDPKGRYTLKKSVTIDGKIYSTVSAHPARFSPDDKFSKYRIVLKKRFNLLPTQKSGFKF